MLGWVLSLCPSSYFRSSSHLVLWDLKQTSVFSGWFREWEQHGSTRSKPLFPSTMYCLVTWETELKGKRKVVWIFQLNKGMVKEKEHTVNASIIMFWSWDVVSFVFVTTVYIYLKALDFKWSVGSSTSKWIIKYYNLVLFVFDLNKKYQYKYWSCHPYSLYFCMYVKSIWSWL